MTATCPTDQRAGCIYACGWSTTEQCPVHDLGVVDPLDDYLPDADTIADRLTERAKQLLEDAGRMLVEAQRWRTNRVAP